MSKDKTIYIVAFSYTDGGVDWWPFDSLELAETAFDQLVSKPDVYSVNLSAMIMSTDYNQKYTTLPNGTDGL